MIDSRLLPLAIIAANDESVEGITRLQKLVFLAQEEYLEEEEYDFEPYDYGPFSTGLYSEVDNLELNGYVECDEVATGSGNIKKEYEITREGEEILERFEDRNLRRKMEQIGELKERENDKPILELLRDIYNKYPEMAKNSQLNIT